jgi:hypothetical protein
MAVVSDAISFKMRVLRLDDKGGPVTGASSIGWWKDISAVSKYGHRVSILHSSDIRDPDSEI